jgi:hypothetical protein
MARMQWDRARRHDHAPGRWTGRIDAYDGGGWIDLARCEDLLGWLAEHDQGQLRGGCSPAQVDISFSMNRPSHVCSRRQTPTSLGSSSQR